MDDGGSPCMKEVESLEDLSTPAPQHFNFHHLEPLQISTREQIIIFTHPLRSTELSLYTS